MYEIDPAPSSITDPSRDRSQDLGTLVEEMALPGSTKHSEVELQPSQQLPAVLRGINLFAIQSRADFIRETTRLLPLNEYNLPLYIYRPDFIDHYAIVQGSADISTIQDMLTNSMVYINYHQGFPTLQHDRPIWQKFEYESPDAFTCFVSYLEQKGARRVDLVEYEHPEIVSEWFHLNYWAIRAKAHDMYRSAHHERMKYHRIFELEDKHYARAEKMLERVYKVFDGLDEETLKGVDPEKLVTMIDKLTKIMRSAAGLSAMDGAKIPTPTNTSVEVLIKRNAEKEAPTKVIDDTLDPNNLLNDPTTLDLAQDLIIKMQTQTGQ